MTAPTNKELLGKARAWPAGTDNLSAEQDLTRDDKGNVIAIRESENVDFDSSGKASRRSGYARVFTGTRVHSLWSDPNFPFALYVDNGALRALRDDLSAFALVSGLSPDAPLSYDFAAGKVYWSNGEVTGAITGDGVPMPWGVPGPNGEPTVAGGGGIGGLYAGTYQVAVSFLAASGEESGATIAVAADVPEGGGLTLTDIPQPPDASYKVRVYVSGANGDVLYHFADIAAGTTQLLVGQGNKGKPLDTQFLDPMPPGQIVRWFAGRLWSANGPAVTFSAPLRYGLTDLAMNRKTFAGRIDMMEPVGSGGAGAGLFIAAGDRTYFLAGSDPKAMAPAIKYPHGVVPGTAVRLPASVLGLESTDPVPYWLAKNGVGCVGLPGGQILPLREGQTVAPSAEGGASLYRNADGLKQVITTLVSAFKRGVAISDRVDCEVIRHDQ